MPASKVLLGTTFLWFSTQSIKAVSIIPHDQQLKVVKPLSQRKHWGMGNLESTPQITEELLWIPETHSRYLVNVCYFFTSRFTPNSLCINYIAGGEYWRGWSEIMEELQWFRCSMTAFNLLREFNCWFHFTQKYQISFSLGTFWTCASARIWLWGTVT